MTDTSKHSDSSQPSHNQVDNLHRYFVVKTEIHISEAYADSAEAAEQIVRDRPYRYIGDPRGWSSQLIFAKPMISYEAYLQQQGLDRSKG